MNRAWELATSLAWAACALGACSSSHDVVTSEVAGSAAEPDGRVEAGASGARTAGGPRTPAARSGTGRGGDPDDYVFSQDEVRHYDLQVDPAEWAHLNETAYLEQYIRGNLTFEGQSHSIGLRFKGFRGSLFSCFTFDESGQATDRTCSRLPLKLSFDEYDEEGRFYGLRKLNFHVLRNDFTLMHDRLSYFVFRAYGVPAPRAVHATLSVNGESLGLFLLVEQIDGRFARNNYEDGGEGNIYKERWPTSSSAADYFVSGLESNRDQPDVSAMQRFAEALEGATDDTIEAVLREHTDFDALMRYFAVDRAVNHWDGPLAFRCRHESQVPALPPEVAAAQTPALGWEVCQNKNYYWYEESASGRLWLVPWDMDVTWGAYSQFPDWNTEPTRCEIEHQGRPPRCDRLINWLATVLRPHYVRAGRALIEDGPFRPPVLMKVAERWYAQIAPFDPLGSALGGLLLTGEINERFRSFANELDR